MDILLAIPTSVAVCAAVLFWNLRAGLTLGVLTFIAEVVLIAGAPWH